MSNELLDKLAEQCFTPSGVAMPDQWREFGRLIVEECMRQCKEEKRANRCNTRLSEGYNDGIDDCIYKMQTSFNLTPLSGDTEHE